MTTQYTPILKLALPVQGELSGTWGDVVNDNITSMVEQAIAGRSVIDTWSANSHVLTTANGTAAESRAAMLSLTDSGTALTGAGSVICPALSKVYIVKNGTAQVITVKTAAGSGIAVPVGKTMLVYCDGTNVLEAVDHVVTLSAGTLTITGLTTFASLKGTGAVTVTNILDEDNMASDSATALVTQQSIKAYVDSQVGANNELSEVLANGNTTGTNDIDVDAAQKVQFRDAAIYINSSVDGQLDIVADTEIQIDTTTVDINGAVDVSGTLDVTGAATFSGNLGIGTSSPTYKLDGGFANQTWGWYLNDSYNAGMTYNTAERSLLIHTKSADVIDHIKFATGGSALERLRIDAVGNLLVGTTDPNVHIGTASGAVITSAGFGFFAVSSNAPIYANRLTNDGAIIDLRKDGTSVGSIGTGNNGNLYLGSGDTGINFNSDINSVYPINPSNGAASNGAIDLGYNGIAFKDLWLSGTVNAGAATFSAGITATTGAFSGGVNITDSSYGIYSTAVAATIGYIGNSANDLTIFSSTAGHNGLRFHDNGILPIDNTGALVDADADLGIGTYRFKDLYLSGTVNAGAATFSGEIAANGGIALGDGDVATFGDSDALSIQHLGGNTYLTNTTGSLILRSDSFRLLNTANSEQILHGDANGAVTAYYDNSVKLATTATGIDVTGTVTADGLTVDGIPTATGDTRYEVVISENQTASAGRGGGIAFARQGDILGGIKNTLDATASNSEMSFQTRLSGTVASKMVLNASGNLGIGTSSPAAKIHTESGVARTSTAKTETAFFSSTDGDDFRFGLAVSHKGGAADADRYASLDSTAYRISTDTFAAGGSLVLQELGGNVGIGDTTFAAGKLQVYDSSGNHVWLKGRASDGTSSVSFRNNADNTYNGRIQVADTGGMLFQVAGSTRATIDASGNLLVGTTVTGSTLANTSTLTGSIAGAGGSLIQAASNDRVQILNRLTSDGDIIQFRKSGAPVGSIGTLGGNLFIGSPNGTAAHLRLGEGGIFPSDSGGYNRNAAIDLGGISSKFKDLYLSGGAIIGGGGTSQTGVISFVADSERARIEGGYQAGGGGYIKFNTDTPGGSNLERMRLDASGNLLVAKTTAGTVLTHGVELSSAGGVFSTTSVAGNSSYFVNLASTGTRYLQRFYASTTFVGSITSTGTATAYNTTSDYRLKEDDVPMTGATERVKALRPINFAWKLDGSRVDGFFAHELAEVVPEAATGTKDAMRDEEYEVTPAVEEVRDEDDNIITEAAAAVMGTRSVPDYQGIDQSKLVPLLTAALQEAIAKIEALTARLEALEGA